MMTKMFVFGFGCPRSGTTMMKQLIHKGQGYFGKRLVEYTPLHPCKSSSGLIELADALRVDGELCVLFVRTIRHPMDIVRSLVYASKDVERFGGVGEITPEKIVSKIRSEFNNVELQRCKLDSLAYTSLLEFRYEDMINPSQHKRIAGDLAKAIGLDVEKNRSRFETYMNEVFGVKQVRPGRFGDGVSEVLSDDEIQWYTEELQETIALWKNKKW